jgi:hypothetical protein
LPPEVQALIDSEAMQKEQAKMPPRRRAGDTA